MNDAGSHRKQVREDKINQENRKTKYKVQVKVNLMNTWHL